MIFSASEIAFLSINKLRIRVLRGKKDKRALRTGKLLDSKNNLLNTILAGNNIVNIAVTSIFTAIAMDLFDGRGVEAAALISTVILLIFGEIAPKSIASAHPEATAFFFAPFIQLVMKVLTPVVRIFSWIASLIAALFGVHTDGDDVTFTEEEIKTFIDAGAEEGIIESGEKHMLRQVFKFTDLTAKEIMVPRTDICAIPLDSSYDSIIALSQETTLSRFPVITTDLDSICGIVYVKDLLFYTGDKADFTVKSILRQPLFILENRRMSSIRKIFRENSQSIGIIVDEYSGTAGLLTIEDVTREIFGNVADEHTIDRPSQLKRISDSDSVIDGRVRLNELSEKIGISLHSDFYDTLGGYMMEKCGDIPQQGMSTKIGGYLFTVAELEGHRISKVLMHRSEVRDDTH